MSSRSPNARLTRREVLGGLAAFPLFHAAAASGGEWLSGTFRELHLDAHFSQLPSPYEGFNAEASAQILKDAGFQMVSFFAMCNQAYCYYPTRIGVRHPGLKRDYTGEMAAALKKRGIRVLAYVSTGPDRRYGKEHPEWAIVRAAPTPARGDSVAMCLNSPWVDEVHIPQLKELVELYNVDGFFIDNLLSKFLGTACYCRSCRQAFGREIPRADGDPNVFAHHKFIAANMGRYAEKVTAAFSDRAFVFTHLWTTQSPVQPPRVVNQVVWEPVPPYPGTHSIDFSLEARYLSNLPGIVNWSCMATRGNGWGDYSLRDLAAFQHEAAVLLASGGRPYLSDDSYPSGNPDPAVYRVYGEVNRRTAEMEPFVKGASPVRDTAVLLSADSLFSSLPLASKPSPVAVAGAHKALAEEHVQFGILNSDVLVETLADYKALILPEQAVLSAREVEAIRRFVQAGGGLIATCDTGIAGADFALADVLGVRFAGRSDARRAFLRIKQEIGLQQMDMQVRGPYMRVQTAGAKTLLDLVAAGPKQAPMESPECPGITLNEFGKGKAIYCALPVFGAYSQDGTPALRRLAAWMLGLVHPAAARTIVVEGAPANVEVTYNHRGSDRFVHLVNFTGDKRFTGGQRIQDAAAVHGIRVRVRSAARPRRVLLAPARRPVAFDWKDGWVSFSAQPLILHDAYMIEG